SCVLVQLDGGARQSFERTPGELEAGVGGRGDVPVPRLGHDCDEEPFEAELAESRLRECHMPVVRRVEGPTENPGHCHSSTSSPISTWTPLRTPAARRALSSSAPSGGEPTTRKPRSVR